MTNFLGVMDDFLTDEEKTEIDKQFVKDNFCPFDEDPFIYEHERTDLLDQLC